MAIGDNVFNVRSNEGNGSSFILGDNPALAHLVKQDELQKQRDYEDQKLFAQELAKVSTQSGKALPNHKAELDSQYKDFLDSYAKTGGKIKVGSPEYIDMTRQLQGLKSNSALAEVYNTHYGKTMEDVNQAIKSGKPYDRDSVIAYQEYMTKTPLSQINPAQIPQLKAKFNIDDFNAKVEPKFKPSEKILEGQKDNFGNITYKSVKSFDPKSYSNEVLANPEATNNYLTRYADLAKQEAINPTAEGTELLNNINKYAVSQNKSIDDPNLSPEKRAELLKPLAVKYLAEQTFKISHPDQVTASHQQDWQAQQALKGANKEDKVKPFVLQREEISDTDPAANALLSGAKNKQRVYVKENGEGENKPRIFNAHSGGVAYLDDKNNVHHLPSGKTSVNGKIIGFIGGDNGQVYAEINGKSKTNYELYKDNPDYSIELDGNTYVVKDKSDGKEVKTMTKSEASQKPDINYYLPAKDVDANLHGEYAQQNKKNDLLSGLKGYFPEHYGTKTVSSQPTVGKKVENKLIKETVKVR